MIGPVGDRDHHSSRAAQVVVPRAGVERLNVELDGDEAEPIDEDEVVMEALYCNEVWFSWGDEDAAQWPTTDQLLSELRRLHWVRA